jgi:hypothetical protein
VGSWRVAEKGDTPAPGRRELASAGCSHGSALVEDGRLALGELGVCAHGGGNAGGLERWEEEFRLVAVLVGF